MLKRRKLSVLSYKVYHINFLCTFISFRFNIYKYAFLIFRDKHIDAIVPVMIALSCNSAKKKERGRKRERERLRASPPSPIIFSIFDSFRDRLLASPCFLGCVTVLSHDANRFFTASARRRNEPTQVSVRERLSRSKNEQNRQDGDCLNYGDI